MHSSGGDGKIARNFGQPAKYVARFWGNDSTDFTFPGSFVDIRTLRSLVKDPNFDLASFVRPSNQQFITYQLVLLARRYDDDQPNATMSADEEKLEMNIAERPSDLIGKTPLISLNRILEEAGVDTSNGVRLVGKMESLNPCSSVKDRLGMSMINEAEKAGLITPGKTVLVEPTSGNTGIALAFLAREKGYRCILTVSDERYAILIR